MEDELPQAVPMRLEARDFVELVGMRWAELEDVSFSNMDSDAVLVAAFSPNRTTGRYYLGLVGAFRNFHSGEVYERLLTRGDVPKMAWDGKEWKPKA